MIRTVICMVLMLVTAGAAGGRTGLQSERMCKKANAEYYSEHYPEALNLYIDALACATKEGNDSIVIACTGYIGNIYDAFGDYNTCHYYYLKGYEAARRVGKLMLQADFLSNLVTCCSRMGRVEEAKHYYRIFQSLPQSAHDKENLYFGIYARARILTAEHRYDDAVRVHREALRFAETNGLKPICRLFQLSEIGNLYVRTGRAREAAAMGDSCAAMAKTVGSLELLVNAYKMLADAYAQLQQTGRARHYREMYFDLNDSVYNIHKFYKARYKLSEYEGREHRQQVSQLNERISMQTWIIVLAAVILGLVLVFSYIIYRKNLHLSQTQRLLIAKNNDLEERDSQNRTLLKQYLEQRDKNRVRATVAKERIRADSTADAAEAQDSGNDDRHDEDAERLLLSHINDVMGNMAVISSPDFSLQTLADMVGSNTSYVSRVINNSYHKNFKTLLNETRIREACHKLTDRQQYEGYTMQVIYEAVGYRNASSFIRAFRKVYNMTPSEFQRLAAEGEAAGEGAAGDDATA